MEHTFFLVMMLLLLCSLAFLFIQYQKIAQILENLPKQQPQGFEHLSQQIYQGLEGLSQRMQQSQHQSQSHAHQLIDRLHAQHWQQVQEQHRQTQDQVGQLTIKLSLLNQWHEQVGHLSGKIHQLSRVLDQSTLKGKYGERQLEGILKGIFPDSWMDFQSVLPNGTRVDCLLKLHPERPAIPIDSKFPLQSFRLLIEHPDDLQHWKDFTTVIKKNIKDISEKYRVPGITTNYALMFVPSDALFLKLLESQDIMQFAVTQRVFLCCPQTLCWILHLMKDWLIELNYDERRDDYLTQVRLIETQMQDFKQHWEQWERRSQQLTKEARSLRRELEEIIDTLMLFETLSPKKTERALEEGAEIAPSDCEQEAL